MIQKIYSVLKNRQKNLLLVFFVFFSLSNVQAQTKDSLLFDPDSLVSFAKSYVGTPYKWGGSSSAGFDCSGFVSFVFRHFGLNTSHGAKDYYNLGKSVPIDSSRKGDVILFTGTNFSRKSVGHVGIVISNSGDSLVFIHSSSSKKHFGVTVTDYYKSAYPKRFMGIRRLQK